MKTSIIIILILSIFTISYAEPVVLQKGLEVSIGQFFCPDPAKSQVPASMTGTIVFKKLPSTADLAAGMINWTNVVAMTVRPTGTSTYYFNDDSTKTATLTANVINFIGIAPSVSKITIAFGASTAEVQGMTKQ